MNVKTREELIEKYISFFESKNHKEIPSASLIPDNDPTVLFTTAGMHPLVVYLRGQEHPLGKKIVSVQKCIRTGDIDEVGDAVHHTFFEMLGNWSFGDYFKEDAIKYSFEFLTKVLGLPKEKLAVSCFAGDGDAGKDEESAKTWMSLGISKNRIAFLPKENNWWGPAGETGPCGPDTEMFYWTGNGKAPETFDSSDGKWVEIWNDVFMQYEKKKRVILIDGMSCLYDKDFTINSDLLEILQKYSTKKIVVVNGSSDKARELVTKYGIEVFSLDGQILKDKKEFFEKLLKKYSLHSDEVVYFDHSDVNITGARQAGIKNGFIFNGDLKKLDEFLQERIDFFVPLKQQNVDTGMGVERTLAVLNGMKDNYQTTIFAPIISEIEKLSGKKYSGNEKAMRIIADHLRAATFILGDARGIKPSNVGQGYVLRRLIRRAIRYGKILGIQQVFTEKIARVVVAEYGNYHYELENNREFIFVEINLEEERFGQTLEKGLKKLDEIILKNNGTISGSDAFLLFQSYGFPIEMTVELAKEKGKNTDVSGFEKLYKQHQDKSRTASAGTFKSGLADDSETTTRLHTATHLLNESLRRVLGNSVRQKGSNITPERLRFDFNFDRKLMPLELDNVQALVNQKISQGLKVVRQEMTLKDALKSGAQGEFGAKYPDIVSVYTIVDAKDKNGWFSKEICTGPHVKNTSEVGIFKIVKEEGVAAGTRRIKAIVE